MGYLTDPKTGKRLTPEAFVKREAVEWSTAIGSVIKEFAGDGKKTGQNLLIASEKDLIDLMRSAYNFKKRR
jgi:hypothetical protein